jgi:hypothetical protein
MGQFRIKSMQPLKTLLSVPAASYGKGKVWVNVKNAARRFPRPGGKRFRVCVFASSARRLRTQNRRL